MRQLVVEYEAAPAAMMAVPSAIAARVRALLQDAPATTAPDGATPRFAAPGRTAGAGSYFTAAGIAAGLVAAWLGLSVI